MTLTTKQQVAQNVLYDLLGDHDLTKSEKKLIQSSLNEFLPEGKKISVDGDFGKGTAQGLVNYFKQTGDVVLYNSLHSDITDLLHRHGLERAYKAPPYNPDYMTSVRPNHILKGDHPTSREKIGWLQNLLNIQTDGGDFGPGTAKAVIAHYKQHPEYLRDINPSMVRRIMAIEGPAKELQSLLKEHAPNALNAHIRELIPLVKNGTGTNPAAFELQAALKAKGLYNGELDGVKGPGLDRAIQTFESGRKLSANTDAFQESVIPEKDRTQVAFASVSPAPEAEKATPGAAPVLPGSNLG